MQHQPSGISWQTVYPPGVRKLSKWMHDRYGAEIIITEMGYPVPNEDTMTLDEVVNDVLRVQFFQDHVQNIMDAIYIDKVPIKAFMAWAFLDNFEW